MARDQGLIDSVADSNIKTIAEAGAHSIALSFQNAVAHQARINALSEQYLSVALKNAHEVDPAEAVALAKAMGTSNLGDFGAIIAALQQIMKGAQTTPPPTAG